MKNSIYKNKIKESRPDTLILVVDDEPNIIESLKIFLEDHYSVLSANTAEEAIQKIKTQDIKVVLLDILLPEMDGLKALKKIKELNNYIEVIMLTAVKTIHSAVQAIKYGAYDYITKPFDLDDILACINKALEKQDLLKKVTYLHSELDKKFAFENIIGKSQAMQQIFNTISEVSKTNATVIIYGESGTGKELVARAIHSQSLRKDKPFITVDCATIPDSLLETELFGHEKGAFTDAISQKLGKFEVANNGTFFLDEIGNLKLDIQSKILRVLQEKEFHHVGGTKTIKVDIRIISATNIDLKKAVKEEKFREDLYYRLNVLPIFIPPLRERKEDIPLLVELFLKIFNHEFSKQVKGFSKEAMLFLLSYKWPGNIRELKNIIERLVVLSKDEIISHKKLPLDILMYDQPQGLQIGEQLLSLKTVRQQFEKEYIIGALEKNNWNQTKTAKFLDIHRNTLLLKMRELNIKEPNPNESESK